MIKTILIQTFLILSTTISFGQAISLNSKNPEDKISKSCRNPIENKEIEFCNIQADTLTFAQLKECKELTIHNKLLKIGDSNNKRITSYILCFFQVNGTELKKWIGSGNQLTSEMITSIIESGTKEILIEEIIGVDGTVNLDLGHRWFYLK